MRTIATLLIVLLASFASPRADAGILFEALDRPDLNVAFVTNTYTASSNEFSSTGFAMSVETENGLQPIPISNFVLNALVDDTGLLGNSTFSVTTIAGNVTLLKGTLTDVEFDGSHLQFLADVDEIDSTFVAFGFGSEVGIQLNSVGGANFLGDFSAAAGTADIGRPVPEPSTFLMFAAVAIPGILSVKRKKRSSA